VPVVEEMTPLKLASPRRSLGKWLLFAMAAGMPALLNAGETKVSARMAVDLAQEQLDVRGLQESVQVESLVLKSPSLLAGSQVWTVLWSKPVATETGKLETGVEIDMSGRVVRLVKKMAAPAKGGL